MDKFHPYSNKKVKALDDLEKDAIKIVMMYNDILMDIYELESEIQNELDTTLDMENKFQVFSIILYLLKQMEHELVQSSDASWNCFLDLYLQFEKQTKPKKFDENKPFKFFY